MHKLIKIHPEVIEALDNKKGVVALESTIISHGMPYPENIETAQSLEKLVRAEGAIPATIAILNGDVLIGLNPEQLELLATSKVVKKVSRRDIPLVLAKKQHGATTVAATMYLASLSGIKFFATGGIGGVHRGAQSTFDISADLTELGKTNVAVVCAGAKAILDLPLTLEVLETLGVPVLGYKTREFPAFYSCQSGLSLDERVDTPEEFAKILYTKWQLGLQGGVVIANPIPTAAEIPAEEINQVIEKALEAAKIKQIKGKEITPFLLAEVKDLTKGQSLKANIALVNNNARLAGQIAVKFAEISKKK